MNAERQGIVIRSIQFTGPRRASAGLAFTPGSNLIYGASNTGKSFALKSLDFMLGGSKRLPRIEERKGYDRLWLALTLPLVGDVTLMRSTSGGAYTLFEGHVGQIVSTNPGQVLSAKHGHAGNDNLSYVLLQQIGLARRFVATNSSGKKRSLSFRDLTPFCIVDETKIQSETSPIESGQYTRTTAERRVLKLLLSGQDDESIVPVVDAKTFRTSTGAKAEVVGDILKSIESQLADFPSEGELNAEVERTENILANVQSEAQAAQESIRGQLDRKAGLIAVISEREQRRFELDMNLARFEQLAAIYRSDMERLETIEEAGFLLLINNDGVCPLCGAPPEIQRQTHAATEIELARKAALSEIAKIERQSRDLASTMIQLRQEAEQVKESIAELDHGLAAIEGELMRLAPRATEANRRLTELMVSRDRARHGLSLIDQRNAIAGRLRALDALKPAPRADRPKLEIPTSDAHDFAQEISEVLGKWRFPGQLHVSFDETAHDIRIDGKDRRDNGKGVRAITHAAFKVAFLLFCRERGLPHPGFVILDTPLLTYRDPIRSKAGALTADEEELSKTSLKSHFFEHLSSVSDKGQFIVLENIDPPAGIELLAHVEAFTGDPENGRKGLL
ncbi:MAG: Chromosome partition protein smc [Edaphobacter sp.]|nr:Chromosome partition protein smc [Edaphobacter sp.]